MGDAEKRARFDRGEFDASGAEWLQRPFYRDFAGTGEGYDPYATNAGFADFVGSDDIFSELFRRGGRAHIRMPGADVHYRLAVEFLEAVNGATRRIALCVWM